MEEKLASPTHCKLAVIENVVCLCEAIILSAASPLNIKMKEMEKEAEY